MATEKPPLEFLPAVEPVTYQTNLIQKAVCELKFPTVYGLVRGKPPVSLATALRKSFPEHGLIDGLNVGIGGVAQDFAFAFADKKKRTTITFRPSALSVETSAYHSFEELLDVILFATNAAREVIDSDFFTRVGLRYINGLPYEQKSIGEWVNPDLVAPLAKGVLGIPTEFAGRIVTSWEVGGFLIQHGIGKKEGTNIDQYVLDFDVWREDVQFSDLKATMQDLHDTEFRLFHWSLGHRAFEHMGQGKPKKKI